MGHEYILNIDDDTIITAPLQYNLYSRPKSDNLKLAVLEAAKSQDLQYTDGLVELTKRWLLNSNYTLKGNFLEQFGDHRKEDVASLNVSAWNRVYYAGYFTLISVVINFVKQVLLLNFPHART